MTISLKGLPNSEIIEQGMKDLQSSLLTVSSLLVCIGKPRLELAGLKIPAMQNAPPNPELLLFEMIAKGQELDHYSYYNSLIRGLISFEKALEQRHFG